MSGITNPTIFNSLIYQIEVMTAARKHRPIQRCHRGSATHDIPWSDVLVKDYQHGIKGFNWDQYIYRIKPLPPREGWIHLSELRSVKPSKLTSDYIKVREVLNDE